jgi:hypothetical protein
MERLTRTSRLCGLEEAIDAAPAGKNGRLNKNIKANVVYALFVKVTLKSKEFKDPFTNKGTVHFVDKTSFKANLNQHAQDT